MENFLSLIDYYAQSHKHPINKIMHLIGVPCVLFSTLIFFSWIHISMPGLFDIHTSWLVCTGLIIYYSRIDTQYSFLLGAILLPFIFLANLISTYWLSFPTFCILFASGWILQLVGHIIEDQQPSFIGKPKILFSLPLLVLVEIMAERGFRPDLKRLN